jgi:predicted Zn-dependent peptidase
MLPRNYLEKRIVQHYITTQKNRMENMNRKLAPEFKTIDKIDLIPSKEILLSNQIPVHIINGGSQDVVKIEFIFEAGVCQQNQALIASTCNSMLNEGTSNLSAAEIAEKMDYYGAYIGFATGRHDASICLYTLNKHLKATLSVTEDVIKNSTFPQKEFQTILQNKKQKHYIDHQKTEILAREKFNEFIYGKDHPYSNLVATEDYEKVNIELLKEFYLKFYTPNRCKIIVAGKVEQETIDLLEQLFGEKNWPAQEETNDSTHKLHVSDQKKTFILKEDAVQASIRLGRPMVNKLHKDYSKIQVLNFILGGYFGSRLMQNIREDKGYTYGINSVLVSYRNAGHFCIVTEVGADVCKDAIKEIYSEIKRIREELVPTEELKLVKNYIIGDLLRNLDSPFSLSDGLKNNLNYNMTNDFYKQFIEDIKAITSEDIKAMAEKYLMDDDLYLIVCGPEKSREAIL